SPYVSPYDWERDIDIGGRSLHVACSGQGPITVVIEPGGPDELGGVRVFAPVVPLVPQALGTKVCAYDRANTGMSDTTSGGLRTMKDSAKDLESLLATDDLSCPCVIVASSMGGVIALDALADDASNIAGLVLLDPVYPGYMDDFFGLAAPGSPDAGLEPQ